MPVTRANLRVLTKIEPCCRAPLVGVAIPVYKARVVVASAKVPPKSLLFRARRPSRRYKTVETSPEAPTALPWTVALSPVDRDHGKP